MQPLFPLEGAIQHYAWGGTTFIPTLLDVENPEQEPFAELWMGAHDRGPAKIQNNGQTTTLDNFIAQQPAVILGQAVAKKFDNRLPYLFKVLDVQKMLSIQSHPTKAQAEVGFQKENEAGVPLTAKHRNFKDDNHKPEIMVALTDFYLLHGFQSKVTIAETLKSIPEFARLREKFAEQDIFELYKFIMELPQEDVNAILAPLQQRLETRKPSDKTQPDYWAHLAFQDYTTPEGNFDRGIFSIYLFNVVKLKPGEGIFQDAGIPHAYLEGVNMELMANSDNVFRGGLTPKHIDVPELLKHLVVDSVTPNVLSGEQVADTERVYRTPAPDFELSRIELLTEQTYQQTATAPDTLIVLQGKVETDGKNYGRGEIFFAPAGITYEIKALEKATLFRATVPA